MNAASNRHSVAKPRRTWPKATLASLEQAAFILISGILLIAALLSLTWPLGYDQGIFAWIGRGINAGGVPYIDAWDQKGPLVYLLYASIFSVMGDEPSSIRIFDLVVLSICARALYVGLKELTSGMVARWSSILFMLWYLGGTFYATAQPDGWVAIALVPALLPLIASRHQHRIRQYVVAGALIGCAILIKQFYVALLVVPLLALLNVRPFGAWRRLGALLVSAALPCAATLLWLKREGALSEYLDVHFRYNATAYEAVTTLDAGSRLTGLVEYLTTTRVVVLLLAPALGGAWVLRRRSRDRALAVLLSWLVLAIGLVLLQNKYFKYHWMLPFPPLAILAAICFQEVMAPPPTKDGANESARPASLLAVPVFLLIVGHSLAQPIWEAARAVAYVTRFVDRDAFIDGFGIPGPSRRASRYLQQHSTSADRVVIWGLNADILYLSKREPPGRFGYINPLIVGLGSPHVSKYRTEFLESFDREPPLFVVENRALLELFGYSARLEDFSELNARVRRDYHEVVRFGDLIVHRRQGALSGT